LRFLTEACCFVQSPILKGTSKNRIGMAESLITS
jgi:hypothetical protein